MGTNKSLFSTAGAEEQFYRNSPH